MLPLRAPEKAEGLHGDIRLPLSAVRRSASVDDPWPDLRGLRAPGTGIPNVIAVGTRRGSFGRTSPPFTARSPPWWSSSTGADFSRLVVTADDAAARNRMITQATRPGLTAPQGQLSAQGGWKLMERATSRRVTDPTTRSPSTRAGGPARVRHMTATASARGTSTSSATTSVARRTRPG